MSEENVNWDDAPEGAERYSREPLLVHHWLKNNGIVIFYYNMFDNKWDRFGNQSAAKRHWNEAEPRPTEEKADRHNKGKPELSYLLDAPIAVKGLSEVFAMGAEKYARDNWKNGLDKNQIIDSLLRHLLAYKNGELTDEESNLCHTKHVLWNALVLAEQHGNQ